MRCTRRGVRMGSTSNTEAAGQAGNSLVAYERRQSELGPWPDCGFEGWSTLLTCPFQVLLLCYCHFPYARAGRSGTLSLLPVRILGTTSIFPVTIQENRLLVERWPCPIDAHTLVLELYAFSDRRRRTSSRRNLRSRRGPTRYAFSIPCSAHRRTVLGCILSKVATSPT